MSADWLWLALLAGPAIWEVVAIANKTPGDTLSERVRDWFSVETPGGKGAFVVAWLGFAAWFLFHILG